MGRRATARTSCLFATSLLLLAGGGASAQDKFQALLPLLEDADRDETRELAQRYLVAMAESPADALRLWAKSGKWSRKTVVLRVLSERGELLTKDLLAGLQSEYWPTRFAAARAAGLGGPLDKQGKPSKALQSLLHDKYASVRREALLSLARKTALSSTSFLEAFKMRTKNEAQRSTLLAVYLTGPQNFSAEVFDALLQDETTCLAMLARLPGLAIGEKSTQKLQAWQDLDLPAGVHCFILLALPRELWKLDPLPIILRAIDGDSMSQDAAERLSNILRPQVRARLLDDLDRETNSNLFTQRLRLARRCSAKSREALLAKVSLFEGEQLEEVISYLLQEKTKGVALQALLVLRAKESSEARCFAWMRQVAALLPEPRLPEPRLPEHWRLGPAFVRMLAREGKLAEVAFSSLTFARRVSPELLAYSMRVPERVAMRVNQLLLVGKNVPATFWLPLLDSEDEKLRLAAAQGLHTHATSPAVQKALAACFAKEKKLPVQRVLLQSGLSAAGRKEGALFVREVLRSSSKPLELALLALCETSTAAWVEAAIPRLEANGLFDEALVVRALRGDKKAAHVLLAKAEKLDDNQLRKLRVSIADSLDREDLPRLRELLIGKKGGGPAHSSLREEVVEWLMRRQDLPLEALLETAFAKEEREEIKDQIGAALVSRGRSDLLLPIVEQWIKTKDEDAEGVLLELLGSLPARLDEQQARFLVRLLIAPVLRDPLAGILLEKEAETLKGRVQVLFPLLQASIKALARVPAKVLAKQIHRELVNPALAKAWAAASKSYFLRAFMLVLSEDMDLLPYRELLGKVLRLGPKPHDTDGVLLLLQSQVEEAKGRIESAAQLFRKGLVELSLAEFPERVIEWLSIYAVPESSGQGQVSLEAKALLLEARREHMRGQTEQSRVLLRRAGLAAREDLQMSRAIEAFARLVDEKRPREIERLREAVDKGSAMHAFIPLGLLPLVLLGTWQLSQWQEGKTERSQDPASRPVKIEGQGDKTGPKPGTEAWLQAEFEKEGITLDRKNGLIKVKGRLTIDRDYLEYLLIGLAGKKHEALVMATCKGSTLNAALLALGLTPGSNVDFKPVVPQPTEAEMRAGKPMVIVIPPKGPELFIALQWKDKKGVLQTWRVEDLVHDIASGGGSVTDVKWIYTGSQMARLLRNGPKFFMADIEQNFITHYYVKPDNHLISIVHKHARDDANWFPIQERVPPRGTELVVIISKKAIAKSRPMAALEPEDPEKDPKKDPKKDKQDSKN